MWPAVAGTVQQAVSSGDIQSGTVTELGWERVQADPKLLQLVPCKGGAAEASMECCVYLVAGRSR